MKTTGYEKYSQIQLHSLFFISTWNQLSFENKMSACQEVENRYAAEFNVQPCVITHEQMDGSSYGWQNGNTICLNTSLVRDGVFIYSIEDSTGQKHQFSRPALAPSWNVLETVYHEGTHGIQEAQGRMPSTYIDPKLQVDLYRIQGVEKEANEASKSRTLKALLETEQYYGQHDISRENYFRSLKNDSYIDALQRAKKWANDPDIEKTLNQVISDRENGISRNSPSPSYQKINNMYEVYMANISTISLSENTEMSISSSDAYQDSSHTATKGYHNPKIEIINEFAEGELYGTN